MAATIVGQATEATIAARAMAATLQDSRLHPVVMEEASTWVAAHPEAEEAVALMVAVADIVAVAADTEAVVIDNP